MYNNHLIHNQNESKLQLFIGHMQIHIWPSFLYWDAFSTNDEENFQFLDFCSRKMRKEKDVSIFIFGEWQYSKRCKWKWCKTFDEQNYFNTSHCFIIMCFWILVICHFSFNCEQWLVFVKYLTPNFWIYASLDSCKHLRNPFPHSQCCMSSSTTQSLDSAVFSISHWIIDLQPLSIFGTSSPQ